MTQKKATVSVEGRNGFLTPMEITRLPLRSTWATNCLSHGSASNFRNVKP
jgi:hypothetical protein